MRRALGLLLATAALALAGCGDDGSDGTTATSEIPQPPDADYILGEWEGELHQKGSAPFTVGVDIQSIGEAQQNTVAYTGIDCAGNWAYEGFEGGAYRFQETIDHGKGGSCKGTGQVTLAPAGTDTVDYEFQGGGVTSTGRLHRSD